MAWPDALAREGTSSTGLPGGIAIPHCRTEHVDVPTLAFARLSPATDFGAKDGPADLAFLIAAPAGGDATHLKLLTQLARALVKRSFTDSLRSAETPEEVVTLVSDVVNVPATAAAKAPAKPAASAQVSEPAREAAPAAPAAATAVATAPARRRIVAVTACPTGIAHTYMAAEALEAAAERAGVDLAVETQGSAGASPLPSETIAKADAAIFAVDVGVRDRARFAGKPLVASGVKRPMDDADSMIAEALRYADDPNAPRVEGSGGRRRRRRRGSDRRRWRRRALGRAHAPGADDRCLLHDPVRRGRRSADRPVVPARWLRDRRSASRRSSARTASPTSRTRPRSGCTTRCSARASWRTSARCSSSSARPRSLLHPGARRLHRLRHRRPTRHRARVRDGWPGRRQ
jgi:fructose-specific phosphotransferase system IIB component